MLHLPGAAEGYVPSGSYPAVANCPAQG